jgi:hypothetical protein
MVPDYAANCGARDRMMPRHMTNDAADGSPLDATVRTCDKRKRGYQQGRYQ